jgi:hypothetical protein
MLTRLIVKNFKRFAEIDIALNNPVIFIGPNNSGKTSALQALALWHTGVKKWAEKKANSEAKVRSGVPINRLDLVAVPVPVSSLLWKDLHLRESNGNPNAKAKAKTKNIKIEIIVEGVAGNTSWRYGLEFDYANAEVIYCRPIEDSKQKQKGLEHALHTNVAYLPPMSGLASQELRLDRGAINVRISEGRTADVLRNLCYQILYPDDSKINGDPKRRWNELRSRIKTIFGVDIQVPEYIKERGEIKMIYRDEKNTPLDLSASGRGLQQVLLLLSYMYANPNAVLLLDEPDAHLEILRQRDNYRLLTDIAAEQNNQLIIATHSEVVLREAQDKDLVVAFIGKPHTMTSHQQVRKSLSNIGFEDYYKAELKHWVLYLEGSTDFEILSAFAKTLNHPVREYLDQSPFVHYLGNNIPQQARDHFYGLREAYPNLKGIAIFDRLEKSIVDEPSIQQLAWQKKEIENYFAFPEVLERYCAETNGTDLFSTPSEKSLSVMKESIQDIIPPVAFRNPNDPWWLNTKMSDDFLDRVFELYFQKLNLRNTFRKTNYFQLASLLPKEKIDKEVIEKLDAILFVAESAKGFN